MGIVTESVKQEHCHRCLRRNENEKETFYYMHGKYLYDVSRARELVHDGREPVEVEEDSVRASVAECDLDEFHLPHVDPGIPGIIAHIHYPLENGEVVKASVLIDGHHRAARCLKDGLGYRAYLLTEEESLAILLRKPEAQQRSKTAPNAMPADAAKVPSHDQSAAGEITRAYEQRYAKSRPFSERGRRALAGGASHDRRGLSPFEVCIDRAQGACKWDVSGQRIIDYWMGHGSLLCGHGFKPVVDAVTRQLQRGSQLGSAHEAEIRWAELVCRLVPSADRVRFTGSRTEAVMLALRLARAYTGRDVLLRFRDHYHGWHDEALAHSCHAQDSGLNRNMIANVALAKISEPDEVAKFLQKKRTAAVILEPGGANGGTQPVSTEFLQTLRDLTRKYGTLLIFDEASSGFRHSPGGVQQLAGVRPDLTILAKILGGGLPGGALAGRAKYLELFGAGASRRTRRVRVPHLGASNANPLSAAAGSAMLEHIADGSAQEKARTATLDLVERINQAAAATGVDVHAFSNGSSVFHVMIGARAESCPPGPSSAVTRLYNAHRERYAVLRRALLVEGLDISLNHGWVSTAHDEEIITATAEAFARAFRRLQKVEGFAN